MSKSRKMKFICLGILTAVMFAADSDEIKIDEKLSAWSRSHTQSITFDSACKVSPAGSILLTAGKARISLDVRTALTLKPNRKYVVSFMAKGENIADERTGAFYHGVQKWERMTRWTGTFDWTNCSCELDTAKVDGDGKISIHFSLFGNTGKLWIDRVKITPKDGGDKTQYTISFYPVNREDNCMNICENLPMILMTMAQAPANLREHYRHKTSTLTMDVPKFVKLMGVRSGTQSGWFSFYNTVNKMTVGKTVVRDGVEYQRCIVDFPNHLALFMCVVRPTGFNYHLLFEAVPGSAGKTGKIYWNFDISGEKYPEQVFDVKVLPPAKMTEPPCREFKLAMYRQYVINHSAISKNGYDETVKYWKSFATSNLYIIPRPTSHMKKFVGERVGIMMDGNDCMSSFNFDELARIRKIMPSDVSLKGVKQPDIAAWALLEDKDKLFEKYLRNMFRMAKDHKPSVKIFIWDNEPFGFGKEGCDETGRKRFAEKMNLKTVPTLKELNGKYKDQYYQYMLKLQTALTRKVAAILKDAYPEAELWMCSGNLIARPPYYSPWAGIDVREIDDAVNVQFNMPYYTGTRFFDDIAFNVKKLKKPNFPIHYPSYGIPAFDYTPKRLLQNMVGSAAVGCIGAGIGEGDILSGEYQLVLAKVFSMISRGEKYYFHGKRCDNEITVMPRNVISRKLSNGKVITSPDFSQVIRYIAHKLNGKYFVTLLNYHQKLPLIAEISGKDFKPVLVKVGPEGCEQAGTDLIPPQKPLQQEIAGYSGGGDAFRDYAAGENKAVWTADQSGKAFVRLSDGKISAGVDTLESGEVISLQNAAGKELLTDGFIGKIIFLDTLQPKLNWKTGRYGLGKDNTPYQISSAEVGPYEGALPDPNPLQGMKIRRAFEVRNGKLLVTFEFVNPTQKEMPLKLRLNNHPWPGFRFKTKNIVLNQKYGFGCPPAVRIPDEGKPLTLRAENGGLSDEITFQPLMKFEQIFIWTNRWSGRKTVEFVFDRKLAPGATLKAEYEVRMK